MVKSRYRVFLFSLSSLLSYSLVTTLPTALSPPNHEIPSPIAPLLPITQHGTIPPPQRKSQSATPTPPKKNLNTSGHLVADTNLPQRHPFPPPPLLPGISTYPSGNRDIEKLPRLSPISVVVVTCAQPSHSAHASFSTATKEGFSHQVSFSPAHTAGVSSSCAQEFSARVFLLINRVSRSFVVSLCMHIFWV